MSIYGEYCYDACARVDWLSLSGRVDLVAMINAILGHLVKRGETGLKG